MAKKPQSRQEQRAVLMRVMRYIRPHLPKLLLSLGLSLIVVVLTLNLPILIGRAIDCILGAGQVDFDALSRILASMAVCIAATAVA